MMKSKRTKRIGVLCWINSDIARQILTGVLRYAETSAACQVKLLHASNSERMSRWTTELDGLIVALPHEELWRTKGHDLPMVQVAPFADGRVMPSVSVDPAPVGGMAAEHLLSLRLRNFLIQKLTGPESEIRELIAALRNRIEAVPGTSLAQGQVLVKGVSSVKRLRELSMPCGILCCKDSGSIHRLARVADLDVPRDLVVMGVGNNVIQCMTLEPTLTSIALPTERMGALAAERLCRMIDGAAIDSVRLPPIGVIPRESTSTLATDDEIVLNAMAHIRDHFSSPITAATVARAVGVSRNTLYEHFQKTLGGTVHEEVERLRLEKAMAMLQDDRTPVKSIGPAVGIPEPANFTRFIRKHTGLSPREHRQHDRCIKCYNDQE